MKIAVVGGGISGIGCAWLMSQSHDVHLFESENRLGGHAHTVEIHETSERTIPIDTGFLVYNELTYPHLTRFFRHLDVETVDSEMSLSVQVKAKNVEWNGASLNTVFAQRSNLVRPKFYRMLFEILRFGREAEKNLHLARRHAWTLSDLLRQGRYSREFVEDYLLPIGAAIWSSPESKMLDFPAATFIAFFINHKLLQVNHRPVWRTVKNGSVQYVQKAAAQIGHVHINTPVLEVRRANGKVLVRTQNETTGFDRVIMATHAPVTAKILKMESDRERAVISTFRYEANKVVLHSDASFMPKRKLCWAAWNVLGKRGQNWRENVSLSYYINRLQPLPTENDYFVTLNPERDAAHAIQNFNYDHPQFDQAAIRAQRELPSIQGEGGVYFAGAWSRYGFHEDGLLSAVTVAELMGTPAPWSVA